MSDLLMVQSYTYLVQPFCTAKKIIYQIAQNSIAQRLFTSEQWIFRL